MLTDPCAVAQKLSTGSAWQLGSLEPEHDGDDRGDRVVPDSGGAPVNGSTFANSGTRKPRQPITGFSGDARQHARRPRVPRPA